MDLGDIPSRTLQIGEFLHVIAVNSLVLGHCNRLARCWKLSQMVFPCFSRYPNSEDRSSGKPQLPSLQSIATDSCHGALPESQWRVGWKSQRQIHSDPIDDSRVVKSVKGGIFHIASPRKIEVGVSKI